MRSVVTRAAAAHAPSRLILLPGAFQTLEELAAQGFAAQVAQRTCDVDLELLDVEMAHVDDREFLPALHARVVLPARGGGRARTWLAGISLGGFIALAYAARYPHTLEGLCLLAPYLGNRRLLEEIAQAPGNAAWQPGELADSDEERRIWRSIRQGGALPPIFLGYGRDDRFAHGHELLAATLPAGSVKSIAGGHDWPVWLELWEMFLESTFHAAG